MVNGNEAATKRPRQDEGRRWFRGKKCSRCKEWLSHTYSWMIEIYYTCWIRCVLMCVGLRRASTHRPNIITAHLFYLGLSFSTIHILINNRVGCAVGYFSGEQSIRIDTMTVLSSIIDSNRPLSWYNNGRMNSK